MFYAHARDIKMERYRFVGVLALRGWSLVLLLSSVQDSRAVFSTLRRTHKEVAKSSNGQYAHATDRPILTVVVGTNFGRGIRRGGVRQVAPEAVCGDERTQ
jgi:hypothetical protein